MKPLVSFKRALLVVLCTLAGLSSLAGLSGCGQKGPLVPAPSAYSSR